MHTKRKSWIIVAVLAALVKLFSVFPAAVEKYYSNGVYLLITRSLRWLFGWLPFSVGDILYAVVGIWLLVKFIAFLRMVFKRKAGRAFCWNGLRWLGFYCLWVYTVFNILWGLNYNRLGMAYQLQLQLKPYTTDELQQVLQVIVQRLDSTSTKSMVTRNNHQNKKQLFAGAFQCYQQARKQYPHLVYTHKSVKPSLLSYLGDYMGYTGYYNPFTGEAQVNTTVPVFVQPFTTCHEIGHQLGYAKENEANFAGYLSAKSSTDAAFTYSVYFDLYSYGIRELYGRDSLQAIALSRQKPLQVKEDIIALRQFFDAYKIP